MNATNEALFTFISDGCHRARLIAYTIIYSNIERAGHVPKYTEFHAHEYTIGAHFVSALIDGDFSGLYRAESHQFDKWETDARVSAGGIGHWTVIPDSAEEMGRCDVTGLRGDTVKVAYMAPTGA